MLALTHRSFAFEAGGLPTNERLEFLGDSVLGFAISLELYRRFPDLPEGELAKRRAGVVSTVALAEVARSLDLGAYVLLGKGEVATGGRDKSSILADTMEALFGAALLSAGQDQASAMVLRLIGPLLDDPARSGAALDPKTHLQELAAAHHLPSPSYEVTGEGPDHHRIYRATVTTGHVTGVGEGTSKKVAEMAAALDAWTVLRGTDAEG